MRSIESETFYELLDIPTNATPYEIRRAYKEAHELYAHESLASYSFFPEDERRMLLSRLEKAYLVLINRQSRNTYDEELISQGCLTTEMCYHERHREPIPIYALKREVVTFSGPPPAAEAIDGDDSESSPLFREIMAQKEISGGDLKQMRITCGVTLEQISLQSKIKITTLEAMEAEVFAMLPPLAYLKGFLKAYAQSLQLDAEIIASGYIRYMQNTQDQVHD